MLSLVHRLLAWIVAHPETTAVAAVTFGLVLWKRLPPARRAAIEARMPRIVNALRVLYALFPDLVKAAYAAAAVVRAPQPPSDGGAGPTAPYRATPAAPPPPPPPPTAARVGLAAIALAMLLVGGALAASCSGSWEQRAHRALVATAHAVAVADDTAAQAYQAEAHAADGGAAFARIDDRYRRIQGAEEALSATLVRAEALLDAVHDAGGDAGTARCLALRALVQLAADARVFGGVLTAAGVTLSADQAAIAHGVAAVIDEMAPRCEGSDAGSDVVTTDAGGDSDA